LGQQTKVLDVGCGDGFTIDRVCRGTGKRIDAVDSSLVPSQVKEFGERYRFVNFYSSLDGLATDYDLVTAFDVIEHNADDLAFVESIRQHAASGGHILLTAPAFNRLFGRHDVNLRHYRRYRVAELVRVVEGGGLRVISSGYLFGSLLVCRFLGVWAQRFMGEKRQEGSALTVWRHGDFLTGAVASYLSLENGLMAWAAKFGWKIPGLTAWVLCRK